MYSIICTNENVYLSVQHNLKIDCHGMIFLYLKSAGVPMNGGRNLREVKKREGNFALPSGIATTRTATASGTASYGFRFAPRFRTQRGIG